VAGGIYGAADLPCCRYISVLRMQIHHPMTDFRING